MLTIVERPLIHYVVDQAREAGIEHFVFVTGRNKGVIEDHFDSAYELEATLQQRGKTRELKQTQDAAIKPGNAVFTRQQKPLGLGHAVWCARDWIGREPFAVLLPDELTIDTPSCTAQLVAAHGKPAEAPSTLALIGRYVLQPEVFDYLGLHETGAGGEIQLTDALAKLVGVQPFHALHYTGRRYDCGSRIGFLEANVAVALHRADTATETRALLERLLKG